MWPMDQFNGESRCVSQRKRQCIGLGLLVKGVWRHFQQNFIYVIWVNFVDGRNKSI